MIKFHSLFIAIVLTTTAAIVLASPTVSDTRPYVLQSAYTTGGQRKMLLELYNDFTFKSSCVLPPKPCSDEDVCPENGGQGTWSWDAKSQLELVQVIKDDWTVKQTWFLSEIPSGDGKVSAMSKAILVKAEGKRSTEFPMFSRNEIWIRTYRPPLYQPLAPLLLPATFMAEDVYITITPDGTFYTDPALLPPKCLIQHQHCRLEGTWSWDDESFQMTLIYINGSMEQVWELGIKSIRGLKISKAMRKYHRVPVRLIKSTASAEFMIPITTNEWKYRNNWVSSPIPFGLSDPVRAPTIGTRIVT